MLKVALTGWPKAVDFKTSRVPAWELSSFGRSLPSADVFTRLRVEAPKEASLIPSAPPSFFDHLMEEDRLFQDGKKPIYTFERLMVAARILESDAVLLNIPSGCAPSPVTKARLESLIAQGDPQGPKLVLSARGLWTPADLRILAEAGAGVVAQDPLRGEELSYDSYLYLRVEGLGRDTLRERDVEHLAELCAAEELTGYCVLTGPQKEGNARSLLKRLSKL